VDQVGGLPAALPQVGQQAGEGPLGVAVAVDAGVEPHQPADQRVELGGGHPGLPGQPGAGDEQQRKRFVGDEVLLVRVPDRCGARRDTTP
jgi:hypothetical protein